MPKKPTCAEIVRRLRELTSLNSGHPRQISQSRFGAMCGFANTQSRISNYENGRRKPSDQDYLAMIRVAGIPDHVADGLTPDALLEEITSRILNKRSINAAIQTSIGRSNGEARLPYSLDLHTSKTRHQLPKKTPAGFAVKTGPEKLKMATDWITQQYGEFLFDRYIGEVDRR